MIEQFAITGTDIALIISIAVNVLTVIERIFVFKQRSKTPHKENEARIEALEDRVTNIESRISSEDERVNELEEGTKVLMKSISALLSHGIDGNNTEEMKEAKKELNAFLISK